MVRSEFLRGSRRVPVAARRPVAMIAVVAAAAVLAAAAPLGAQQPTGAGAPLTLADAIRLVRDGTPASRVVDARRDMAVGRAGELGQFTNPILEWRRENLGSPLQPDIFTTFYIPFDVTGRRLQLRSAAGAGRTRAAAEFAADRRAVDLETARRWLRAAAAIEREAVLARQAEAYRELATVDSLRFREGIVAEGVAMRTRLEADRAQVALAQATAETARARGELAQLLGVGWDRLPTVAPLDAPDMPDAPDVATTRSVALAHRPELAAREAGVREASARASAESRGILGEWQLQTGTKETGGFLTGQLGVALPLPAFNQNAGARLRVRGELIEATALRDLARVGVAADAEAARSAYLGFRATAPAAATFGTRGVEIATIARVAYREGQATLLELLDAERASVDARIAHLQWKVDAWLLRLEFERALGARLDERSPLDLPLLPTLLSGTAR
jgi:cobalt-zinc-cadmium efflux system outer membrane protein